MGNQVTLQVTGMSCGHCVSAVEGSLTKLDGVENVKVNLKLGKVDVSFDADKVTVDKIKDTIDEQGYDVDLFKE